MRLRHRTERNKTPISVYYTVGARFHREDGPALVDKKFGSNFWLGAVVICFSNINCWVQEMLCE